MRVHNEWGLTNSLSIGACEYFEDVLCLNQPVICHERVFLTCEFIGTHLLEALKHGIGIILALSYDNLSSLWLSWCWFWHSLEIKVTEGTVARFIGHMIHHTLCFTMGSTSFVLQKERWKHENVHWLQMAEPSDNKEQVFNSKNRWTVWLVIRSIPFFENWSQIGLSPAQSQSRTSQRQLFEQDTTIMSS